MKIGSLFSGYGGLDRAVESVTGATTAWVSDIDKGARKILAHRYPDVPNLGDITSIDWATVEPVDIITGGFPCQDLSHAGKRAGLKEGTRSGLWSHMARAINELRPRLVVAENVRGLLSADAPGDVEPCSWCVGETPTVNLRALGVVLADLADLGYDAQWCGLRAADVGACHGRFRVFLIAHPAGDPWRLGHRDDVDAADTDLVGHERGGSARGRRAGSADGGSGPVSLLPTPMADDARRDPAAVSAVRRRPHVAQRCEPAAHACDRTRHRQRARPRPGQGSAPAPHARRQRQDWDDWTDAMKAKHGNGNGHGAPTGKNGAHRLSPRFVEFMMGLPEGWVTDVPSLTRNEALKALGNGVVPQQAEAALRHMLAWEMAA